MVVVRGEEQGTVRPVGSIQAVPDDHVGNVAPVVPSCRTARIQYSALYFRFMLVFGRAFECFVLS